MTAIAGGVLTIDLRAIVANWLKLDAMGGQTARCAAVVKANAYGLGAVPVSQALYKAGCRQFFVAVLEEAMNLRPLLPEDAQILVLHGLLPGTEDEAYGAGVTPVLNSVEQVRSWAALARKQSTVLDAVVQVDTGMRRLGMSADEWSKIADSDWSSIRVVLLMSHLVAAEEPENPLNDLQRRLFEAARARFPGVPCSLANSSGVFLGAAWHFDLLRPGAALYGISPTVGNSNPMEPVIRLQGRIIQWRRVSAGDGVGYNHTWHATVPGRVATVSIGYADGWLRSLSNRSQLMLGQHKVSLIGRVSMDTVTIDVSAVPEDLLQPGSLVDFVNKEHDVNAVALEAGTNAYEILTSLGNRFQRHYIDC